jgi:hypothetical protein
MTWTSQGKVIVAVLAFAALAIVLALLIRLS